MPGKIDEISSKLGNLDTGMEMLNKLFDKHCDDDDRRHEENQKILHSINEQFASLNSTMAPLASTVKRISPIVDDLQISRWRFAGAVTLATVLLGAVGWFVTSFLAAFFGWLMPHFK